MDYNWIHDAYLQRRIHLLNIIINFSPICIRIKRNLGVFCPQLAVKYPQLPALINGKIETIVWCIRIIGELVSLTIYAMDLK